MSKEINYRADLLRVSHHLSEVMDQLATTHLDEMYELSVQVHQAYEIVEGILNDEYYEEDEDSPDFYETERELYLDES